MYIVAEHPVTTTFMTYSEDGAEWVKPIPFYKHGYSFSTPVTHQAIHYVAADKGHVELLRSTNGLDWTCISTIVENGTETALVFLKDDILLAVTRQAVLSKAKPPYTEWENYGCEPVRLGGPDAVLVGDTVLVAGRHRAQTHLLKLHPDTMTLDSVMDMPVHNIKAFACGSVSETLADTEIASTEKHVWPHGDKAYPEFLVLDDHRVLMAYYDGQAFEAGVPMQADIRLAPFTID